LAVLLEADLERVAGRVLVADVDGVGDDGARALVMQGRLERVGQAGLVEGLAGELVEGRLGVERLEVAVAAGEEDPDDRLRAWPVMRLAVGGLAARDAVAVEHGAQRQAGEAQAEVGEEGPAMRSSGGREE